MTPKEYLKEKQLSISKFAALVQCNRPYLTQIINGIRTPSFKLAKRIEQTTGGAIKRTYWYPND